VVLEGGRRTLYVVMLKALYGMMKSSLLYYLKFRGDLEVIGSGSIPMTRVWRIELLKIDNTPLSGMSTI